MFDKVTLPDSWGDQSTTEQNRTKATQLVACVSVAIGADAGRDVTCRYRSQEEAAFGGDGSRFPAARACTAAVPEIPR